MSQHDNYSRSLQSFRPSVYTTGTQPTQAYNTQWSEGFEYGDIFSDIAAGLDDQGVDVGDTLQSTLSAALTALSPDLVAELEAQELADAVEERNEKIKNAFLLLGSVAAAFGVWKAIEPQLKGRL